MYNFIIDYYQRLSIHILWENYNALVYFYAKYIFKYVIVFVKNKDDIWYATGRIIQCAL